MGNIFDTFNFLSNFGHFVNVFVGNTPHRANYWNSPHPVLIIFSYKDHMLLVFMFRSHKHTNILTVFLINFIEFRSCACPFIHVNYYSTLFIIHIHMMTCHKIKQTLYCHFQFIPEWTDKGIIICFHKSSTNV